MTSSESDLHPPQDPLDECLKNARWPEPTGLQGNRLEAQWEHLAAERARSRRRLARWTLAASVLLALSAGWGGWLLLRPGPPQAHPPDSQTTQPQLAEDTTPNRQETNTNPSQGQAPTRYEQAMFSATIHRKQKARVLRKMQPLIQTLNQALNDPQVDLAKHCEPLLPHRLAYEQLILTRIGSWTQTEQKAALKVLKEIGSRQAIPVLDRLSRDPKFEKIAWPVALHLATPQQLAQWATSDSPTQRREALQTLVQRDEDFQALGTYLHLVAQPKTRSLAIEVLKNEPQPPVDSLFAFLSEGTKKQRHVAGLVLGRIANPAVTKRLTALARKQGFPPEVMIALLNSSDQQAIRFLSRATRDPLARTAVQLARLEWELISYTATFPQPMEIY